MIIGVDIDEVLAGLIIELNNYYNYNYNANYSFEDYKSYDLELTWKTTKKEAVQVVNNFFKHPFFERVKPIENSQKSIELLSKKNKFVAITARPNSINFQTKKWIDSYFSGNIIKIVHTNQYELEQNKQSKLDICLSENVDLMIEDNLNISLECASSNIPTFLIDKPWNKINSHQKNLTRIKDWGEILNYLK